MKKLHQQTKRREKFYEKFAEQIILLNPSLVTNTAWTPPSLHHGFTEVLNYLQLIR